MQFQYEYYNYKKTAAFLKISNRADRCELIGEALFGQLRLPLFLHPVLGEIVAGQYVPDNCTLGDRIVFQIYSWVNSSFDAYQFTVWYDPAQSWVTVHDAKQLVLERVEVDEYVLN